MPPCSCSVCRLHHRAPSSLSASGALPVPTGLSPPALSRCVQQVVVEKGYHSSTFPNPQMDPDVRQWQRYTCEKEANWLKLHATGIALALSQIRIHLVACRHCGWVSAVCRLAMYVSISSADAHCRRSRASSMVGAGVRCLNRSRSAMAPTCRTYC